MASLRERTLFLTAHASIASIIGSERLSGITIPWPDLGSLFAEPSNNSVTASLVLFGWNCDGPVCQSGKRGRRFANSRFRSALDLGNLGSFDAQAGHQAFLIEAVVTLGILFTE
jgi:hypothetical protein